MKHLLIQTHHSTKNSITCTRIEHTVKLELKQMDIRKGYSQGFKIRGADSFPHHPPHTDKRFDIIKYRGGGLLVEFQQTTVEFLAKTTPTFEFLIIFESKIEYYRRTSTIKKLKSLSRTSFWHLNFPYIFNFATNGRPKSDWKSLTSESRVSIKLNYFIPKP